MKGPFDIRVISVVTVIALLGTAGILVGTNRADTVSGTSVLMRAEATSEFRQVGRSTHSEQSTSRQALEVLIVLPPGTGMPPRPKMGSDQPGITFESVSLIQPILFSKFTEGRRVLILHLRLGYGSAPGNLRIQMGTGALARFDRGAIPGDTVFYCNDWAWVRRLGSAAARVGYEPGMPNQSPGSELPPA